ncbi:hypothetical protein V8F20_010713, partial [Naviculisporaceae sp. PSN 640]
MVSLPGSYPLDDSVPATPEEPSSHRHHSHHDRNKLHKPNDPRSHQQSDSGVAGFGQHEADSSRAHAPSGNEYLDATGGDYYTYEPMKASSAVESENIHSTAPRATHQDIQHDIQQEPHSREAQSSPKQGDTSESAPYWGDLPKGQRGGIYNTVTGHGSAKDDHDQHHHIPERSAARERSHIPGPVGAATEKSTSRVYNTVTGHGSRDQESKRHTASSRASGATVSSTEAVHDAPLVGIPEEKPFDTGLSSTAIPSSDLGMGFLPETAAGDDAKLLARHEEQARSHDTSRTDTMPSSDDHRGRDAMLAGAGVAGTGIAASEFADRHERNRESRRSISEDRHGRKRLSKTDKKYKDTSSSGSDYSNHKDKPSPEERKSHDEGSPKGEKLSHKILGIFGLNKDEKPAQEEPAPEPAKESSPSRHGAFGRHKHDKGLPDTSTTEPPKEKARDKSPRHSGDKKKEAAVGAAAGLGAAGLMSRKNDEEKNKHHQEPAESSRHHEHHNQTKDGKQTSVQPSQQPVSHDFAQPTTKTSGPASSKGSSSKYGALSSGTASGVKSQHGAQGSITQKPGEYNSLQSGTASGVKTHDEPQRAATQSSRDKTSHSGTASGVAAATAIGAGAYAHKEKESSRRGSTGAYNKLASGTPSGVVVEPRKHRASEDQGRRPGDYKLFPTDSSSPQMHQQRGAGSDTGSGNTQQSYQLPPPPMSGSSANTGSTGVQDSKRNDVGQSDKHSSGPGFVSVPIHSRSPRHDQHHENTNKDTADRVRHMSPEVMPSEYTTSSPRTGNMSHSAPYGNASNADQVRHMSPEVMPSSYTSSAPRSTQLSHSGDMTSAGQGATAHSHSSDVDPALAAATGAWASTGGPSVIGGSGLPAMNRGSGGKVMHTCEHCGKENDITAY